MANTTNFGWETPDDTDLVKDGAAAMRTLGNSIDASFVDLKGGTTGQILSKNSNTDLDYVWIANDQGDITGVTATTPLTGGGTSGAVTIGIQDATTAQKGAVQLENSVSSTSTTTAAVPANVKTAYDLANGAIQKTVTSTTGDIIYASAANTPARLGIGSSGQLLSVSGGIPAWTTVATGSMTSLASGSYTGTALNITGLPTTYNKLILQVNSFDPSVASRLNVRFNADATNKYLSAASVSGTASNYNQSFLEQMSANQHATDTRFALYLEMYNYAGSTAPKLGWSTSINVNSTNTADCDHRMATNGYNSTTAISQINIFEQAAGTFSVTYQVWGVK